MILDIDICSQTITTWRLLGILILIIKIVVPIILIVSSSMEMFKIIVSKNPNNIKPTAVLFLKKFIAALLVFFAPYIIYSTIDLLIKRNDKQYYKCNKCLFFPTNDECGRFVKEYEDSKEYVDIEEDIFLEGILETEELTEIRKAQAQSRINNESSQNEESSPNDRNEAPSKVYQKYNKDEVQEEKFVDNAINGPVNNDVKAIGINGGVRIAFKKVKGAKSYTIVVKDYKGNTHKAIIPDNVKDSYAHDYDVYKYTIGDTLYWDIKKINHEYKLINTWMDANNKTYQFKLNAYSDSNGRVEINHSEWLSASPFNVEKDVPELDVIFPNKYTLTDPEDPTLKGVGFGSKAVKKKDMKRLDFSNIDENNGYVSLNWYNDIPGFTISKQTLGYHTYSDGNTKFGNFTEVELSNSTTSYTINGLNNETTYIISLTAEGKYNGEDVTMQVNEFVTPHTASSRRNRLNNVRRGNPQAGNYSSTSYLIKPDAEAFANYGYNGGAFKSNTDLFIWVNLYELRVYIFRKDQSKEWRLWKDTACGIGGNRDTTPGLWTINGKEWIWVWQPGNKNNSTFSPDANLWNPNSGMTAVQWLVNFEPAYMGNVFHTETYHSSMQGKIIRESRFVTSGCIQLDRLWEKWLYDYSMASTVYVDAGG